MISTMNEVRQKRDYGGGIRELFRTFPLNERTELFIYTYKRHNFYS